MKKSIFLILTILLITTAFSQAWNFQLQVVRDGGDEADTTWAAIFGTDFGGSDGYDDGVDIPLPVAPPGVPYVYFPLSDTTSPFMTMLTQDMRAIDEGEYMWQIYSSNIYSGSVSAIWDSDDYPFGVSSTATMQIGGAYPGTSPSTWQDMSMTSSFDFSIGQVLWIHVVMDPSDDTTPPEVVSTFPSHGAFGVDTMTATLIEIIDAGSGPDTSSLVITIDGMVIPHSALEFTRITSGYEITYLPDDGWGTGDSICISVDIQDNATPANVMSTYTYCFETTAPWDPSDYPPFFEAFSIEDGDTGIFTTEAITFRIRDIDEGVDSSTIAVTFGGSPFSFVDIESVPGFPTDYNITLNPPPGGWTTGSTYNVEINACDLYTPANCTDTSFTFTVESMASLPIFTLPMNYWTSIGTDDTSYSTITIKTSPDASNLYDAGIDAPCLSPGFASFAYFPIVDPSAPMVDKLSTDARHNDDDIQWEVMKNRPETYNGIRWSERDVEDIAILTSGILRIGYGPDEMSLVWADMTVEEAIEFDPTDLVFIRFSTDTSSTSPPIVRSMLPADGASDVPDDECISFEVIDTDDGVDEFHLYVGIEGGSMVEVSPSDMDITVITGGYQVEYCPDEPFEFASTYNVRVEANDFSGHDITRNWAFTTEGWCLSMPFTTMLTLHDFAGDTTSNNLFLGVGTSATDSIDPTDVTIPLLPPSTTFYFPAPAAMVDGFTTDMRGMCPETTIVWELLVNMGIGDYRCEWDSTAITGEGDWKMAIAKSGEYDTEPPVIDSFTAMTDIGHLDYTDGEKLWLIYTPEPLAYEPPTYCITGYIGLCDDEDLTTEPTVNILEEAAAIVIEPGGGTFAACELDTGAYTLVITADSYEPETLEVSLVDSDILIDSVYLWSPSCEPLSNLSGHITVEGEPVDSVIVTLGFGFTLSDDEGYYEFTGLIEGDFEICFNNFPGDCYADTCFDIVIPSSGEDLVVDFDYSLPTIAISGNVMLDSEPFEGVEIHFCDSPDIEATTDAFGEFTISDLVPGSYCIEAITDGFDTLSRTVISCVDTAITFEFFASMVTATIDISTDCGAEDSIEAVINGSTYYGGHHEISLSAGDSLRIHAEGAYLTMLDTVFTSVDTDIDVDLELYCLHCISSLEAEGSDLERPIVDELIANYISWETPVTSLPIAYYLVFRDDVLLDTVYSDIEYTDTDIDTDVSYDYRIDIAFEGDYYREGCVTESAMSTISADPSRILIIDYDDGANPIDGSGCAEAMGALLDDGTLGYGGGYTITSQNPEHMDGYEFTDYDFVILELGIRDAVDEYVATSILVDLISWLSFEESAIMVEGPDFAEDYSDDPGVHQNFFNLFGIEGDVSHFGNDETIGNVSNVYTTEAVFAREWDGVYAYQTLVDRSNDDFILGEAITAMTDQESLIRMTEYAPEADKKRIASSIYLNAMSDGSEPVDFVYHVIAGILEGIGIDVDYEDAVAENEVNNLPNEMDILSISPNPFNPETRISYSIDKACHVEVDVFDVLGNKIATLVNSEHQSGNHEISWNASDRESGIYYVRISRDGVLADIDRVVLIK